MVEIEFSRVILPIEDIDIMAKRIALLSDLNLETAYQILNLAVQPKEVSGSDVILESQENQLFYGGKTFHDDKTFHDGKTIEEPTPTPQQEQHETEKEIQQHHKLTQYEIEEFQPPPTTDKWKKEKIPEPTRERTPTQKTITETTKIETLKQITLNTLQQLEQQTNNQYIHKDHILQALAEQGANPIQRGLIETNILNQLTEEKKIYSFDENHFASVLE